MSIYPRLARDAMRKNKRLYLPYLLTGAVMVMMYYILSFLIDSPAIEQMAGGGTLREFILPMGCGVIAIFSVLFLFYSNSFLLKQRYREFGLYNILGMDRRNIGKILAWETFFAAVISIAVGLLAGVGLSKLAELILLNMLHMEIDFSFSVGLMAMLKTCGIYAAVFMLLLLNAQIKVRRSKPLELMQKSRVGEKGMKCTPVLAVLGVLLLGVAYYLAVSIEEPLVALAIFFVAVIFVILGTYLLFIAGSVTLCKLLQRNKRYYYRANHFVSVSSMGYRMRRNGAGLASICILLTMVLVMISSTASLYAGEEDAIVNRYPNGVNIDLQFDNSEAIKAEKLDALKQTFSEHTDNLPAGMRACYISGLFSGQEMIVDRNHFGDIADYDRMGTLMVMELTDYNAMMRTEQTLAADECLIFSDRIVLPVMETFGVEYGNTYRVKEVLKEFTISGREMVMTTPYVYLVVEDLDTFAAPLAQKTDQYEGSMLGYQWSCGFDEETETREIAAARGILAAAEACEEEYGITTMYIHSRATQRNGFYEIYGSLFFLGIMLSIVFLLAAVLIIYYKQISEGYEDQGRFEIMQKVGMTKRDIRRSINSQLLTVFFLPLVVAGLHLAFALPFISKILLMFAFDNTLLNVLVSLICFAVFGALYAVVYKITSGAYYAIVSGGKERE